MTIAIGAAVNYTPSIPIAPMNWAPPAPLPAVVVQLVNPEGTVVSLDVTDLDGTLIRVPGANMLQPGDAPPAAGNYCLAV